MNLFIDVPLARFTVVEPIFQVISEAYYAAKAESLEEVVVQGQGRRADSRGISLRFRNDDSW